MKNYEVTENEVTENSKNCINCAHCYIPADFLLGIDMAQLYCNEPKDKPLSGDVLSEPFNYYDKVEFEVQDAKWAEWSSQHLVCYNGVCESFGRVK